MSKTTPEEAVALARKHQIDGIWSLPRILRLAALIDEVRGVDAEPVRCPVCHEERAHTGTCGSNDPRALCNQAPSQPAAPVELPVVAWMMEWTGHSPSLTTDKTDYLERDRELLIPLVKLSDAQAAIAAGRKAS